MRDEIELKSKLQFLERCQEADNSDNFNRGELQTAIDTIKFVLGINSWGVVEDDVF